VACEQILGAYSGGAVPDSHRLPIYNACVLLKQFQTSTSLEFPTRLSSTDLPATQNINADSAAIETVTPQKSQKSSFDIRISS
jgi:hypothetical protein